MHVCSLCISCQMRTSGGCQSIPSGAGSWGHYILVKMPEHVHHWGMLGGDRLIVASCIWMSNGSEVSPEQHYSTGHLV